MSDTDKADGVICLDSEEDGTPPKKKGTVKEKKLKDSVSKPKQKTEDNKVGREIHSVTRRVAWRPCRSGQTLQATCVS